MFLHILNTEEIFFVLNIIIMRFRKFEHPAHQSYVQAPFLSV